MQADQQMKLCFTLEGGDSHNVHASNFTYNGKHPKSGIKNTKLIGKSRVKNGNSILGQFLSSQY